MCFGRSGCKLQWPLQSPRRDSFTAPRPYQSPPEGVLSLGMSRVLGCFLAARPRRKFEPFSGNWRPPVGASSVPGESVASG